MISLIVPKRSLNISIVLVGHPHGRLNKLNARCCVDDETLLWTS